MRKSPLHHIPIQSSSVYFVFCLCSNQPATPMDSFIIPTNPNYYCPSYYSRSALSSLPILFHTTNISIFPIAGCCWPWLVPSSAIHQPYTDPLQTFPSPTSATHCSRIALINHLIFKRWNWGGRRDLEGSREKGGEGEARSRQVETQLNGCSKLLKAKCLERYESYGIIQFNLWFIKRFVFISHMTDRQSLGL